MAGKRGMKGEHLGGARPNAGRPVKGSRVELGDFFAVWTTDETGRQVGLSEGWTVTEVTRGRIIFQSETGDRIRLTR